MSSSEELSSRASPIDASLVDTNAGEVPADRPHFAFWPQRLPRTLTLPETSLWHNLDVAARRYPAKAATLSTDVAPAATNARTASALTS